MCKVVNQIRFVTHKTNIAALWHIACKCYTCIPIYLPWTVTLLVAVTVDAGVSIFDWQVYCPPCDVYRGLNERVRVEVESLVEPVVL